MGDMDTGHLPMDQVWDDRMWAERDLSSEFARHLVSLPEPPDIDDEPEETSAELAERAETQAGANRIAALAAGADPGGGSARLLALLDPSRLSPAGMLDAVRAAERLASWTQATQHRHLAAFARPGVAAPMDMLVELATAPGQPLRLIEREATAAPGELPEFDENMTCSGSAIHGDTARDRVLAAVAAKVASAEVSAALLVSPISGSRRVAQAIDFVDELPATLTALQGGVIDRGRALMIADRTQNLPHELRHRVEGTIVRKAATRTAGQLRGIADRAVIAADPAAAKKRHEAAKQRRGISLLPAEDGMSQFRADLPADRACVAFTVLDQIALNLSRDSSEHRPIGALRADAFADIFDQLADHGAVHLHGILGPGGADHYRPCPHATSRADKYDDKPGGPATFRLPAAVPADDSEVAPCEAGDDKANVRAAAPAAVTDLAPCDTPIKGSATAPPITHTGDQDTPAVNSESAGQRDLEVAPTCTATAGPETAEPPTIEVGADCPSTGLGAVPATGLGADCPTVPYLTGAPTTTDPETAEPPTPHTGSDRTPSAGPETAEPPVVDVGAHFAAADVGADNPPVPQFWTGAPTTTGPADTARCCGLGTHHGRTTHLNVTIAATTLAGLDDLPCELEGHGAVPADLVRALAASAATITAVAVNAACGTALDLGRTTYRPRLAQRDRVIQRDQTCRFVGCRQPAWRCQIDHSDPYCPAGTGTDGGITCPCNLACLCAFHHNLKTFGLWETVHHADDSITWTSPTGRSYTTQPREWLTGLSEGPSHDVDDVAAQPMSTAGDADADDPPF